MRDVRVYNSARERDAREFFSRFNYYTPSRREREGASSIVSESRIYIGGKVLWAVGVDAHATCLAPALCLRRRNRKFYDTLRTGKLYTDFMRLCIVYTAARVRVHVVCCYMQRSVCT